MRLSIAVVALLSIFDQFFLAAGDTFHRRALNIPKLYHHHEYVRRKFRNPFPYSVLNHELYHARNVVVSPTSVAPNISSPAPLPILAFSSRAMDAIWDNRTETACMHALAQMNGTAPNPSGVAACYNVAHFDNSSGVFQADLRIYRISAPVEDWVTLESVQISVGIAYSGAAIVGWTPNVAKRGGFSESWPATQSIDMLPKRSPLAANSPQKLSIRQFSSKITQYMPGSAINELVTGASFLSLSLLTVFRSAALQALSIPTITLTLHAKNVTPISTILSLTQASFLTGLFAHQIPANANSDSKAIAPPLSTPVIQDVEFVMPGTKLEGFPTGLVITLLWTVLFVVTVGGGTIIRMKVRDQYKRRMRRSLKSESKVFVL
ncbi:hypothetical protein MMC12_000362 [Toensbergia leucococca]|nr:hypothetical protein [Toensbergia leucococca]